MVWFIGIVAVLLALFCFWKAREALGRKSGPRTPAIPDGEPPDRELYDDAGTTVDSHFDLDDDLETLPDEYPPEGARFVYTKVAGISYRNPDGSSRQNIARRCSPGERIVLQPEPDNPYDSHAVAVLRENGDQLGYVPADRLAEELSRWIPEERQIECIVTDVTGGESGKPTLGVNLRITIR
jgi:hypothetical protein